MQKRAESLKFIKNKNAEFGNLFNEIDAPEDDYM